MTTTPTTATPPPNPPPAPLPAPRPAAPPRVQLAVLLVALLAAVVVPGTVPGLGVALMALAVAVVVSVVRTPGQRRSRWQWVHGSAAVLLAASAAVRDAGWVVALDLLGALLLGTLALAPAGRWAAVLLAPLRPVARLATAAGWLLRGVRTALGQVVRGAVEGKAGSTARSPRERWPWLVPALRAAALTAAVLAVFVPLLSSADARFGAVFADALDGVDAALETLLGWVGLARVDLLFARAVVCVVAAVALGAALVVAWDARGTTPGEAPGTAQPGRPLLARRVEWLLPLGALDALFAAFLLVRTTAPDDPATTYAEQVHAGFAQLVVATALVLGVLALGVRWTPMTAGPRAALAVLCVLSLGIDAAALADLHAYVDAYGLTRLRIGAAVISGGLAALLVLLLVAGARAGRRQAWVPHAAVVVAAASLLTLTAADPDAAIARSQLARAQAPGTPSSGTPSSGTPSSGTALDQLYVRSLSADAVPALAAALRDDPGALGPEGGCVVRDLAGLPRSSVQPDPDARGWASANASRARAERIAAGFAPCAW